MFEQTIIDLSRSYPEPKVDIIVAVVGSFNIWYSNVNNIVLKALVKLGLTEKQKQALNVPTVEGEFFNLIKQIIPSSNNNMNNLPHWGFPPCNNNSWEICGVNLDALEVIYDIITKTKQHVTGCAFAGENENREINLSEASKKEIADAISSLIDNKKAFFDDENNMLRFFQILKNFDLYSKHETLINEILDRNFKGYFNEMLRDSYFKCSEDKKEEFWQKISTIYGSEKVEKLTQYLIISQEKKMKEKIASFDM